MGESGYLICTIRPIHRYSYLHVQSGESGGRFDSIRDTADSHSESDEYFKYSSIYLPDLCESDEYILEYL